MTHETLDQIKLAQHKPIAKKLRENPETILALARRNLQRYIGERPAPATSLWREWRTLLEENSIDRIVAVMTAKTQKAAELRQASVFAGALTQEACTAAGSSLNKQQTFQMFGRGTAGFDSQTTRLIAILTGNDSSLSAV